MRGYSLISTLSVISYQLLMQVVLLKDVAGVGGAGETKRVSDGYALNFLIPRKLAEMGTAQAIRRAEQARARKESEKEVKLDLLMKNLGDLEGAVVKMSANANDKGHLFAALHPSEIAAAVKAETRLDIPPECIVLEKPVKETGEHIVKVKTHGRETSFTLIVEPSAS